MSWYNGFSPKERSAKGNAGKQAIADGTLVPYTGPCMLCGDPEVPVEPHSEDYSLPYRWMPPEVYWLCRNCHRSKLHGRFRSPELWEAFKAHVRRGGYARELKEPVVASEFAAYRAARKRGLDPSLRQLRPRQLKDKEWWDGLRMDVASLTDPGARPRP